MSQSDNDLKITFNNTEYFNGSSISFGDIDIDRINPQSREFEIIIENTTRIPMYSGSFECDLPEETYEVVGFPSTLNPKQSKSFTLIVHAEKLMDAVKSGLVAEDPTFMANYTEYVRV